MGRPASADWISVRDEWVNRRLAGEQLALKGLAAQKDLKYETLRKQASAGRWHEYLEQVWGGRATRGPRSERRDLWDDRLYAGLLPAQ